MAMLTRTPANAAKSERRRACVEAWKLRDFDGLRELVRVDYEVGEPDGRAGASSRAQDYFTAWKHNDFDMIMALIED